MRQSDIELVKEPIPNMALLDAVVDRIESDPSRWDQGSWGDIAEDLYQEDEPCGTTNCFAGHAVIEAGALDMRLVHMNLLGDHPYWQPVWYDPDGKKVNDGLVPELANQLLGLTEEEADDIFFYFGADLMWIKARVEEIRFRARRQAEAFDRIAEELLSDPDLIQYEAVLKKGWCPESQEALARILRRDDKA